MPHTFDELDIKRATEIVQSRANDQASVNRAFYNGDHWNAGGAPGDGWVGPRPEGIESGNTLALIERAFVSRNAIAEVVTRHTTAVAGKQVHWKFTVDRELGTLEVIDETGQTITEDEQPTEQENALISEAEAVLVTWFDRMEAQELFQQLVTGALLGKRGVLRLYVPPGVRDDNGNVPAGDLSEQLDRIWLQCLNLNEDTLEQQAPSATIYVDKRTRREVGIFAYTEDESDEARAEIVYVDDNGATVLRIVNAAGDVEEPVIMDLGGRLTMYEMTRQALVSPQMISQQKALNLAETSRARNDVTGGFLERILLNAQLPGEFVDDVNAPNNKRFVPEPFHVGAGTTNLLQGVVMEDEDGTRRIASPSVSYRDPVLPDTFIRSSQAAYMNILAESNQLHYATAGDAATSGESRKQARESYIADLDVSAGKLQAAARWALETALAMAAVFAGTPGRFDGLRAYVEARINSGPVSAEERRSAREMYDAELWSKERTQSETGIDDVDAEEQRIAKERQRKRSDESADLNSVQSVLDSLRGGAPATNGEQAPAIVAQNGSEVA